MRRAGGRKVERKTCRVLGETTSTSSAREMMIAWKTNFPNETKDCRQPWYSLAIFKDFSLVVRTWSAWLCYFF